MVNDIPARMVFAGKRWRVFDTPTRISHPIWSVPVENPHPLYGGAYRGPPTPATRSASTSTRASTGGTPTPPTPRP